MEVITKGTTYYHRVLRQMRLTAIRPHMGNDGYWLCRMSVEGEHITDCLVYYKDMDENWLPVQLPKNPGSDGTG